MANVNQGLIAGSIKALKGKDQHSQFSHSSKETYQDQRLKFNLQLPFSEEIKQLQQIGFTVLKQLKNSVSLKKVLKEGLSQMKARGLKKIDPASLFLQMIQVLSQDYKARQPTLVLLTRRHKTQLNFKAFAQTLPLLFPWSFSLLCP